MRVAECISAIRAGRVRDNDPAGASGCAGCGGPILTPGDYVRRPGMRRVCDAATGWKPGPGSEKGGGSLDAARFDQMGVALERRGQENEDSCLLVI